MTGAATVAARAIGLLGVVQLALGLLFWTGNALGLVNVHIVVGLALVLTLWTLAGLAARAGVSRRLVLLAVAWGVLTPVLGLTQAELLPGGAHWLVQVLHPAGRPRRDRSGRVPRGSRAAGFRPRRGLLAVAAQVRSSWRSTLPRALRGSSSSQRTERGRL